MKILFVEDGHAWRAVFGEFLRNEGFTVREAAAIIDVRSGMQLANRLAKRYPHITTGTLLKSIRGPIQFGVGVAA